MWIRWNRKNLQMSVDKYIVDIDTIVGPGNNGPPLSTIHYNVCTTHSARIFKGE